MIEVCVKQGVFGIIYLSNYFFVYVLMVIMGFLGDICRRERVNA